MAFQLLDVMLCAALSQLSKLQLLEVVEIFRLFCNLSGFFLKPEALCQNTLNLEFPMVSLLISFIGSLFSTFMLFLGLMNIFFTQQALYSPRETWMS